MAKQMMANPQIKQAFLQYVGSLGGTECNKWNQVADYLQENFQFHVPHPPYLRQVWDTLQGEKEDFTTEELQEMLKICITTRLKEANEIQGISVRVFKRVTNRLLRKILIVMVSIFSRFKRRLARECRQITPKTIKQMLRMIDLEKVDGEIEEMQVYSRILEKLYLKFSEHLTASKERLFGELRGIVNRRQFERIIGYLQQIQELNKLCNQKEQLINHPFLKQQIEDIKQTELYQQLHKDWESKYQLYNEIDKEDNEEYQYKIDQPKQQIRIRRNNKKIKKNKNIYYRDPKTIVFEEEILGEQDEKLQSLYQDVFQYQI